MARFLHVADLHLSSEEYDYSMAVAKEIVGAAAALDADAILMAGHLATDARAFGEILERATCEWLWVPGAGEPSASCPNVRLLDNMPFDLIEVAGVEILALPHRASFADYRSWAVPEKRSARRLALVHAPVVTLPSLSSDAPDGAIDPGLFETWSVDYAALGSAHQTCAPSRFGSTLMADPGSARITTNEAGIRGGFLVDVDDEVRVRWIAFARAGQRREVIVPVALDGSFADIPTTAWSPDDAVELRLSGALWQVDPEAVAQRAREAFHERVRQLEVDSRRLTPVSSTKLAAVARRLNNNCTGDETTLRAREQGLSLLVTAG